MPYADCAEHETPGNATSHCVTSSICEGVPWEGTADECLDTVGDCVLGTGATRAACEEKDCAQCDAGIFTSTAGAPRAAQLGAV
jgi:hypothetical protein